MAQVNACDYFRKGESLMKKVFTSVIDIICGNQLDKILFIVDEVKKRNVLTAFIIGMMLIIWMMYCLLSVFNGSNFWVSVIYFIVTNKC